jgi:hypothetical protein
MNHIFSLLIVFMLLTGCTSNVKTISSGFYTEKWYINPANKESRKLGGSTKDYGASTEKRRDKYIIKYYDYQGNEIPNDDLYKIRLNGKFWHKNWTKERYMENKKRTRDPEKCFDRRNVFLDDDRSKEALEKRKKEIGLTKYQILFMSNITKEECIKKAKEPIIDDWQDDPNQFYYKKDELGKYVIYDNVSGPNYMKYRILPIKWCIDDEWCELYPGTRVNIKLYVKKSALYK